MSRTRIFSFKMENNLNNNFSSLLGLDACSFDSTSFQNIVNKPLGNGKQYIVNGDYNTTEINNSLLNTLNVIDTTFKTDNETYTLDDLLDLGNPELNSDSLFDSSFDDNASLFNPNGNDFIMETAMPSPLSSSSEESCDLDEILFMDEEPTPDSDVNTVNVTEALIQQSLGTGNLQSAVEDAIVSPFEMNGTDLSALCSLLFQNQDVPVMQEVTDISQLNSPASSDSESEPSSPASESNCDDVRYKPYKKPKSKEQKLRKKAQNRTAATRYRVKKKDELKLMVEEADQLEDKNKDLRGKVDGLRTEIDYLKNLMLDVIKARLAKGALPENLLSVVMAK